MTQITWTELMVDPKETQVCHINMLKAYHEKPKPKLVTLNKKLGLENPTLVLVRNEMHSESQAVYT